MLRALVLLIFLVGCKPKTVGDSDDGLPHIRVISPASGSTIPTCLRMTVEVDNFEIVSPVDHQDLVDGQGHWQMQIDDLPLLVPCEALECAFSIEGLDDGPVSVVAVLADNTYVPITDADGANVQDSVSYTLAGDGVVCE